MYQLQENDGEITKKVLVVPVILQKKIMQLARETPMSGHLGFKKRTRKNQTKLLLVRNNQGCVRIL